MFYFEKELLELFAKSGIKGLKCVNLPESNLVDLDSSDLQSIIDYAKANDIDYLFYSYSYASRDFYLVDESKLVGESDLAQIADEDISLHNEKVNMNDFEQPALLDVFCLHNGFAIYISNSIQWVNDLVSAKKCIEQLKEKYYNELNEIAEKRSSEREILLEELKPILLNDAEFALCTNQNLRREFIKKFLLRQENERYKHLFFASNGYFNSYAALNFADSIYAIYKRTSKR